MDTRKNEIRNDDAIQMAARNLFAGSAPERMSELMTLWNTYQPRFNLLPDTGDQGDFILDAGAYRDVRFNHRVMRAFWVSSYGAWEAYTSIVKSVNGLGASDWDRLNTILTCVDSILESKTPDTVALPFGIPEPGILVDRSENVETRAVGELAILAAGWAFLHEVKHIQHQQDGSSAAYNALPEERHREEFSCDEFATTFLLENVDIYADQYGYSRALVRQKRQLGIYFALFGICLLCRGNWGKSVSHPSIQERIDAIKQACCGDGSDDAKAIACLAFYSLQQIRPGAPVFEAASHSIVRALLARANTDEFSSNE